MTLAYFTRMAHILVFLLAALGMFAGQALAAGGPQLGKPGQGSPVDKSGDAVLQKMIAEIAPQFEPLEFSANGATMRYNLFSPSGREPGKKYPLVLFMADASTPGADVKKPLVQGYGALVWATPEAQAKNPCYVLVPQFSGVAVNDAYEHTPEVETVLKLLKHVVANHAVDANRLYATGQSMGGMISMYYNIKHPGIFAASIFVDCHWDKGGFDKLVEHPFIMIYAGRNGKAWQSVQAIEDAARKMSRGYTWSEWSARLPQQTQDDLASNQLEKGKPVNLMGFENGTVLPEDGGGSEHMHSFDHAYRLTPAREWLFGHSLEKSTPHRHGK